jgi:hypothetical protein
LVIEGLSTDAVFGDAVADIETFEPEIWAVAPLGATPPAGIGGLESGGAAGSSPSGSLKSTVPAGFRRITAENEFAESENQA